MNSKVKISLQSAKSSSQKYNIFSMKEKSVCEKEKSAKKIFKCILCHITSKDAT